MRKFILVIFSLSLLLPMLFSTKVMAEKREPNLPPPGKTVSFYLTKGGRLLESGNFSLAIAYLEASLKAPRKGVKMSVVQLAEKLLASARLYEQARLIREAGQQEAAVEKYLEIMKINPVDPRPLEFIVEIYDILSEQAEKKKDYREAARLYENWVKYAPANDFPKKLLITNLRLAADEAFTSSDVQAAVLYYKKLLELDPTDVQIEKKIQEIEKKQELAEIEKRFQNNVYDQTLIGELTRLSILYPEETKLKDMIRVVQGRREMRQADSLMASYKYHEAFNLYKKASLLLPEEKEKIEQRIEEIQIRTGANYSSDGIAILRGTIQGSVKLSLSGKSVKVIEGKENIQIKGNNFSLPLRPYDTKIERIEGDFNILIIDRPSRTNQYSLLVQLTPKNERVFAFALRWSLQPTGNGSWKGEVAGKATLRLQGPFIDSFGEVKNISFVTDPIPHQTYTLRIDKPQATINIRIIEQPKASNDYTTVVEVTTTSKQVVELFFQWQIE